MSFFRQILYYFACREQAREEGGAAAALLSGLFCAACINLRKTLCKIDFPIAGIYNDAHGMNCSAVCFRAQNSGRAQV